MTRETVGKVSSDLIVKTPDTRSPIEQMQENLTEYEKNVWDCVARSKKEFPDDFYVVVITKNEKLMPNVFRNYFFGRLSCPTPDYDQTVYKYKRKGDSLVFMWVIPSRDASLYLLQNSRYVAPEERELLKYVRAFSDETLATLAKELNGEKLESIELENQ